ncbi:MAG: hypothetical protein QXX25_07085 [Thermofilaceae archaeon]
MSRSQWPTLILLLLVAVHATASPPRHVNPEEVAPGRPDPQVLSSVYSLLANLFSAESYGNASQLVNLLLNVSAAPDMAHVLRRFHEILGEVNDLLNLSRAYLEQAKRLAVAGRIEDSAALLSEAVKVLAKANLTRADLELAAREVQRRLGAQPAPLLRAVSELIARHSSEAADLGALGSLLSTELTVEVEPKSAWVGSTVRVTGKLTSLGSPLSSRKIAVAVGGSIVGSALTDESGSFTYQLRLPYVYRRSLAVGALYLPEANDARVYRPASNSTEIYLLYETPKLSVRVQPPVALPGDRVKVEVVADRPGLLVEVWVLHTIQRVNLKGETAIVEVEVPADASEGVYRVLAASTPNGTLGPASAEATLTVRKLDLKLNVTAPPFVALPFPARFTVCVEGWNGTPPNYRVKLSLAGASFEVESQQVCATLEATAPPLTPTGSSRVEVIVTPASSRYRPARAEAQTFIANLLLLIPAVGLLTPLVFLAKPRNRVETPHPSTPPLPSEPQRELEEPYSLRLKSADPVVNEYLIGLRMVEKATGVLLKPSHTISEYLQLVEPKLGRAARLFATLSGLAEARLYGGFEVPLESAKALREQLGKLLGASP